MPVTAFTTADPYTYLPGFNTYHETSAVPGALPIAQNSPQKAPLGLYAEKLSGTAFTAPRHENQQAWLYRILPASSHAAFAPLAQAPGAATAFAGVPVWRHIPTQLRWDPHPVAVGTDFVSGLRLVAGAGDPVMKNGLAIYTYGAAQSMDARQAFYSADGDFLVVPQRGALDVKTEFGRLVVRPNEIVVVPRGVRWWVGLLDVDADADADAAVKGASGYALELFQGHFQLPELGPIGTNGLANSGDFQAPTAAFEEDTTSQYSLVGKFAGKLYEGKQNHTPFDVVAWKGNYYPYKYDLGRFNTMGTISYDHPDPSIFTVLTAQSDHPGTAIADFVIFPPRWLVGEDTFRPPYYHRNCMSEFMGMISGEYDGKAGGFVPGGASLHNVMSGHGPDAKTFTGASNAELKPVKVGEGSMAFMFESCFMLGVTDWALENHVQTDYNEKSWEPLMPLFKR